LKKSTFDLKTKIKSLKVNPVKYAILLLIIIAIAFFLASDTFAIPQQSYTASDSTPASGILPDNTVSQEPDLLVPPEESKQPDDKEHTGEIKKPNENEQPDKNDRPGEIEHPDETDPIVTDPVAHWQGKVNGFDINFDVLKMLDAKNARMLALHEYFDSLEPAAQNEKTGIFDGYNLITVSAEAFTSYVVDPERTPTLYKMQHEGIYFENFYGVYGGGTIAGELSLITGLDPRGGHGWCNRAATKYLPFSFASQFNLLGIQPYAYHNGTYTFYDRNVQFPDLGYSFNAGKRGMNFQGPGWHFSDTKLIELSIDRHIKDERFHIHYMTVCGHSPYSFEENAIARKNRNAVNHLSYSPRVKAYLATQMELEYAMTYLLERLEEEGIAERTLIVLTTDHYPYGLTYGEVQELAGHRFTTPLGLHKNAFFIYVKGMEPEVVTAPSFTPDIVPTVSNMLGLHYDSRLLPGRDVFSDDKPVIFFGFGYMTDTGYYERRRGRFTPFEAMEVPEGYVSEMTDYVDKRRSAAERAVELNYFARIKNFIYPPAISQGCD